MILSMDNQEQSQELYSSKPGISSRIRDFLSKNRYIVLFIALLVLASFGSTGYILIANKQDSSNRTPIQESPFTEAAPTVAPLKEVEIPTDIPDAPTSTPAIALLDQTATLSAFLSAKYNYSLNYPLDWTASISAQKDPKILEYVVFNPKNSTQSGALSITLSYGTRTYQEALAIESAKGEVIFVASVSATKKKLQDSQGKKSTSIIIPVDVGSIIINAKEAYLNILDQMLTTLKLRK